MPIDDLVDQMIAADEAEAYAERQEAGLNERDVTAVLQTVKLTFAEHESQLAELVDTLDVVEPGMEAELKAEIAQSLKGAIEKRERTAQFILDERGRIEVGRERLKAGKNFLDAREAQLDKFENYVAGAIKLLGTDAKGKYPVLKGILTQLRIQQAPSSVKILDAAQVPVEYKTLTLEVGAAEWQEHLDWCKEMKQLKRDPHLVDMDDDDEIETLIPVTVKSTSIDKAEIKNAIEAGAEVPGADIQFGEYGLRVDYGKKKGKATADDEA